MRRRGRRGMTASRSGALCCRVVLGRLGLWSYSICYASVEVSKHEHES